MSLHTVFLSDLFRKHIFDAHSAPLCFSLNLTGEQIYSDLKTAKTPKHDVVCPERTGHSRKLLKCLCARCQTETWEEMFKNHKNPLLRSNKRSAVTHEMLSRMLHFTDCAWIFHEHYPVENQWTSVLSAQWRCTSAWKSTGIILKISHQLLTVCYWKTLQFTVEHKISKSSCNK